MVHGQTVLMACNALAGAKIAVEKRRDSLDVGCTRVFVTTKRFRGSRRRLTPGNPLTHGLTDILHGGVVGAKFPTPFLHPCPVRGGPAQVSR